MFERWRLILVVSLAVMLALATIDFDTLPKAFTGVCYVAALVFSGFALAFKERL